MRKANRVDDSIPDSTYRLQFNKDFPLQRGRELVQYLSSLGISHLYCSPLLDARMGSTHCYDVTNHDRLNPEVCTEEELAEFSNELSKNGMKILLDIVPNHMAASVQNKMWDNLLKNGTKSKFWNYFDIFEGSTKVILPILGEKLDDALRSGKIRLEFDEISQEFYLSVYEQRLPVSKASYELIQRLADSTVAKRQVEEINLYSDKLVGLLEVQNYILEYWKDGLADLNYRRFFDVTDLVAIKEEHPQLFKEAHRLVLNLIQRKVIHALRIDHPDGLLDPEGYLRKLKRSCCNTAAARSFYLIVEKIITQSKEQLPESWPVSGTTGYDFLNLLNGLYVDRRNSDKFRNVYRRFTGDRKSFEDTSFESKMLILGRFMQSDVRRLVIISETSCPEELKLGIEFLVASFPVYRTYIRERTVVEEWNKQIVLSALKTARKKTSNNKKATRGLDILEEMFQSLTQTGVAGKRACKFFMTLQQLTSAVMAKGMEDTAFYRYFPLGSLNEVGGSPDRFGVSIEEFHQANIERLAIWPNSMLATSTHDTKRSEDVRARINALSESPEDWSSRLKRWTAMNRKFLTNSKSPSRLLEYLLYQTLLGSVDSNDIRAIEGSLVVDPSFVQRMVEYTKKASKEAKLETSWSFPDLAYEMNVERFVRSILSNENQTFLTDLMEFASEIRRLGKLNSFSQIILKMTAPGVPDFYQGTELFDYSLVDPDNRRPVDFSLRNDLLGNIGSMSTLNTASFTEALSDEDIGTVKLFLIRTVLNYRRRNHDLFAKGKYLPLKVTGIRKRNVVAFSRYHNGKHLIVLASRFFKELGWENESIPSKTKVWSKTYVELPKGLARDSIFNDILTGEKLTSESEGSTIRLNLSHVFRSLPFALLEQS